jgi:hypothetical protein
MPRSLSFAMILMLFAAFSAAAQSLDSSATAPPAPSQDSAPPAETKKPKRVWTNENLAGANGTISVVGDPKSKPKPASSKPANAQYVASVRKQLDKLQGEIAGIDKQLIDLKNFSAGEPSTSASGIKLNQAYQREPIEVQMRALQDQKKDLESKIDALLDEARKKGVESGQLR